MFGKSRTETRGRRSRGESYDGPEILCELQERP